MSKVSKHCSILNYIRYADEELYDLIQELCIGRILVPRKGSPGVTFLRPDKSLLKEIRDMAAGDNPEEAVDAIQALLLLDYIPTVKDFDDKKNDIPTFHRKKLPVVSADGKKVVLKNGAEIVPDKDFTARGDRSNIAVYVISKALVPVDGETADFSNASTKKPKKGGADLKNTRAELFEQVVRNTCELDREPAMELIVSLYGWALRANKSEIQLLIESQVSYDALASLAIILQPYKSSVYYIEDGELAEFRTAAYGGNEGTVKSESVYSFNKEMVSIYSGLVEKAHPAATEIKAAIDRISSSVGKTNIITKLSQFYEKMNDFPLPSKRKNMSAKQLFAEAELRVMSAVLFDNSVTQRLDPRELIELYKKCNLNEPYMCMDRNIVASANVGFYYSTVYLIARSNALLYVPGIGGSDLSHIAAEDAIISVDALLRDSRHTQRENSRKAAVEVLTRLEALKAFL
jgi:hypothetical protein